MSQVSIIIPTFNEAASLGRTLSCLKALDPPAREVLVIDGRSEDETVAVAASSAGVRVLSCEQRGRSIQMNQGAKAATGDILCFLHADTWVPDDLIVAIEQT